MGFVRRCDIYLSAVISSLTSGAVCNTSNRQPLVPPEARLLSLPPFMASFPLRVSMSFLDLLTTRHKISEVRSCSMCALNGPMILISVFS